MNGVISSSDKYVNKLEYMPREIRILKNATEGRLDEQHAQVRTHNNNQPETYQTKNKRKHLNGN